MQARRALEMIRINAKDPEEPLEVFWLEEPSSDLLLLLGRSLDLPGRYLRLARPKILKIYYYMLGRERR